MTFLINPYQFNSYDSNAQAYITAVETADGQALETAVKDAINAFVVGCKADSIWTAIKASCILAGARTLAGALVPLVGAAPTNNGPYVSADYDRKTGLVGSSTAKNLGANRSNTSDPIASRHIALYASAVYSSATTYAISSGTGGNNSTQISRGSGGVISARVAQLAVSITTSPCLWAAGLIGVSRSSASSISIRGSGITQSFSVANSSEATAAYTINANTPASARIAFYSIGENLNLALLDTRVTTLINALAAAIP